ncbi:DMT family transporter [Micromonospora sp. NPDC049559]|uniref:DMT family transporter n=1 Tax=Micromonospora sp. NPDC049559 TaxID=3155923 RepID=UPI00343F1987
MSVVAIVLGLAAAALFAVGSVLEQRATKRQKQTRTLDPRLLLQLLREPMWFAGWVPDLGGTVLQAVALRFGPLALVEPMLLAGVLLAIPLEAAFEKRRPHARDLTVVVLGAIGLAAFLVAAAPRGGINEPKTGDWLRVMAALAVVFAACLFFAWCARNTTRGILLGVATGLLYALAASLLKSVTVQLGRGLPETFSHWHVYALLVAGVGGMMLNQNAFQGGPIAAPLTTIAMTDPVVSIGIGITAFHEQLSVDGPRLAIEILAGLLMIFVLWLAHTIRGNNGNNGNNGAQH